MVENLDIYFVFFNPLTTKYFFLQNVILFSDIVLYTCKISVWDWSNIMNI